MFHIEPLCKVFFEGVAVMRQGEQSDLTDMDDIHFMVGTYANQGKAVKALEAAIEDVRDEQGHGGVIRPVQFFEVSVHPEVEEEFRKRLSALHSPDYFEQLAGRVINKVRNLMYSMTGIDRFQPVDDGEEVYLDVFDHVYAYVVGEHDERSHKEPRGGLFR